MVWAMGAVDLGSFRLAVRSVRPADIWAFVPRDACPFQRFINVSLILRTRARAVGVFDAHEECAAKVAGEDHIEKGDIGRSDMRVSRRGGSNSNTYFIHKKL